MPTFKIITLGCKVNQCESAAISECLTASGWTPAQRDAGADVCIINTCTVTGKASMQSRQATRQAVRANPGARILVTGCYAQVAPDDIRGIAGVDVIVGHGDKHHIPELIRTLPVQKSREPVTIRDDVAREREFREISPAAFGARTRPALKIQDGCNAFCTYCIVPYARGRSRSMPAHAVSDRIRTLAHAGYHEVVLSGVHLGAYGLDLSPRTGLLELLKRLDRDQVIDRIRLSSIEPHELSDEIIQRVAASKRFCDHFHIPLQSGDDGILEAMHRPYSRSFFVQRVNRIHEALPDAAIGVDVLVGFPGESADAFENTRSLVESLPLTYLHVFPFSPRKGTPAEKYPHPVPAAEIKSRCRILRKLGAVKKERFYRKNLGKTGRLLIEGKRDPESGLLRGLTSNYIPVLVAGDDCLKNTFADALLERLAAGRCLYGSLR